MARTNEYEPTPPAPAGRRKRTRKGRPGLFLQFCTLLYALLLLGVTLSNIVGPERWWFGSLNLYLPQWPWALPCVVLLPWYLVSAWRWIWVPLLALLWVFGPIMGFCTNVPQMEGAMGTRRAGDKRLRVMTYNVKWGNRDPAAVIANIEQAKPDLVLMQDSSGALDGKLQALRKDWKVTAVNQYTILSHAEISDPEERWITPDHGQLCLRCVLHLGDTRVTLYNVHFITPRWALGQVQQNGSEAAGSLQENVNQRQLEAIMVASYLRNEKGPRILTGDLNAPVQSRACQTLFREGLRDAFSAGGWGYGYTYGQSTPIQKPYMRIDHILVSPEWEVLRSWEGGPQGSDHSPVIAELVLPASP